MVVLSLFRVGVLQLIDVVRNGYWHARSASFMDQPIISTLEFLRLPADVVFIVAGVVPMVIATVWTYLHSRVPLPVRLAAKR